MDDKQKLMPKHRIPEETVKEIINLWDNYPFLPSGIATKLNICNKTVKGVLKENGRL